MSECGFKRVRILPLSMRSPSGDQVGDDVWFRQELHASNRRVSRLKQCGVGLERADKEASGVADGA